MKEFDLLDEQILSEYLQSGESGEFYYFTLLASLIEQGLVQFSEEEKTAEVELMTEGTWLHPMAPNGVFASDRARIDTWVQNFKNKIMGPEVPLDFFHIPDSRETPGFIVDLYRVAIDTFEEIKEKFKSQELKDKIWERIQSGKSLLFATIKVTAEDIWNKIKEGSLKYLSASINHDYEDPASGERYDVIKGAALTNYPYIKNMIPISVNHEEVFNFEAAHPGNPGDNFERKEGKKSMDTDLEVLAEELDLEEVEEIECEDGTAFFAKGDKYGMPGGKAYGFKPKGKAEPYGFAPRIEVPPEIAKLPKNKQKAFLIAFNKAYRKYKDVDKAKRIALKIAKTKYGFKFEEDDVEDKKTFGEKFEEFLGVIKKLGFKLQKEGDKEAADKVELEALKTKVVELSLFRESAVKREDESLLAQFDKITPAAKNVILSLLSLRTEDIEFEDKDHNKKKTSVRGLTLELINEIKNSPKVNLFEVKSEKVNPEEFEDIDVRVKAYLKDHPDKTYKDALLEVSPKH